MSKLSNFSDAPIEVKDKFSSTVLKVYPILGKRSYVFDELSSVKSDDDKFKIISKLIKESLRDEEVTDEELDKISTRVQNQLMDAIIKVNGYGEAVEDAKKRFFAGKSKQIKE